MNGTSGKYVAGCAKNKGCLGNILWLNRVADIDEPRLRIDTKYYPLHSCYIGVSQAEISGQGYYGTHIIPKFDAADY